MKKVDEGLERKVLNDITLGQVIDLAFEMEEREYKRGEDDDREHEGVRVAINWREGGEIGCAIDLYRECPKDHREDVHVLWDNSKDGQRNSDEKNIDELREYFRASGCSLREQADMLLKTSVTH